MYAESALSTRGLDWIGYGNSRTGTAETKGVSNALFRIQLMDACNVKVARNDAFRRTREQRGGVLILRFPIFRLVKQ